ncbi:MAG TPA: hypothetical protein VFE56_10925 [Candidatus Binataceae bacterium]|jgi:hypothetical protein|nr:hypothetical protein [Candidatus Binataceae bacterium]
MALSPPLLALLITIFTVLIAVTTLVVTFAGRQSELALSLSDEISRRKCTRLQKGATFGECADWLMVPCGPPGPNRRQAMSTRVLEFAIPSPVACGHEIATGARMLATQ